jgi:hypothetical protein
MPRETVISGLRSAIPAADGPTAAAENQVTSARPAGNFALEATPISQACEELVMTATGPEPGITRF